MTSSTEIIHTDRLPNEAEETVEAIHRGNVDAVVAMDFFSSKAGVLCGVAEAVRLLGGVLQDGDEAYAMPEGARMDVKETVLRVRAPYSRFGVYETALLGMLSSCSGWASAAHPDRQQERALGCGRELVG